MWFGVYMFGMFWMILLLIAGISVPPVLVFEAAPESYRWVAAFLTLSLSFPVSAACFWAVMDRWCEWTVRKDMRR